MSPSKRKVIMSIMCKEELSRRRSPRISGLINNHNHNKDNSQRVKVVNGPTRATKKKKLRPLQHADAATSHSQSQSQDAGTNDVEEAGEEQNNPLSKSDGNDNNHVIYQDQPSRVQSTSSIPEKGVLERVIDILQRRDTYEIFAEPVDPKEVEDYYEIIKEPMDFGTMRAKLHEGMYTSLEQFEHDVFLISENAMHFNSSTTVYFRQARAIHEVAKKVFHVLKTDPDNFESEFSDPRRRSTRRQHNEASGVIHSSKQKLNPNLRNNSTALNVPSLKTMPLTSSGSQSIKRNKGNIGTSGTGVPAREHETLSGSKDGRKNNSAEVDRRSTYIPWMSFASKNDSSSTSYSNSKTLMRVNQQDIGYKESLMRFVKDLGPTAQKIAKQKLQGLTSEASMSSNYLLQTPNCQNPAAFTSNQPQRPITIQDQYGTSMSQTGLGLNQFQGLQNITTSDSHFASRWEDYSRSNMNPLGIREPNYSGFGLESSGRSQKAEPNASLDLSSVYNQPDITQCSWRNNPGSLSLWPNSSSSSINGLSSSSTKSNQAMPMASQFTFDLPYLRTRLDQMRER